MCLAVPGKIVSVYHDAPGHPATVSFGGVLREVSLLYVPEAVAGQYVLVHVGVALSIIDEQEAAETLDYLELLAELPAEGETSP